MNRNRILLVLLGAAVVLPCLQSCWKEEEDIFEESASARVQNLMDECAEALVNSEYGWYMEMYPEASQCYGGWVHTFVFDGEKVKARSELFGADYEVESYYKMTNDNSAVLSFDTYNEVIHYFSTPSSSSYVGYEGEFEFSIMDVGSSVITLMGKKTGNTMYLRKLETDAESYLTAVSSMNAILTEYDSMSGTIGDLDVTVELDPDYRQISIMGEVVTTTEETYETLVEVAYAVTDEGLRLYKPVTVSHNTFSVCTVDPEYYNWTSDEAEVSLEVEHPYGWQYYSKYEGNYTLYYYDGEMSIDVTLTPSEDGTSYIMTGLNENYQHTLTYDRDTGTLGWNIEWLLLDEDTGYYVVFLAGFDIVSSSGALGYGYSTTIGSGVNLLYNGDSENPAYEFEDNGIYSAGVTGWFIMYFNSTTSLGSSYRMGLVDADGIYAVNGMNRMPLLVNMVKND